jgi:hypothetical protein
MKAFVFLICICFLLLSGGNAAMPDHHSSSYTSVQHIKENQQIKFTATNQHSIIFDNLASDKEVEYFICEEDEDENVSRAPEKKCKSINNCYLSIPGIIILSNHYHSCNAPRLFYSSSSNKYISQRALRI